MKKITRFNLMWLFVILSLFFSYHSVLAADSLALTITPPIIKNNINPGQIWKSYIKIVNNNNVEIDAYVDLMNFESEGETGTARLTPKDPAEISANPMLINNWVIIDRGPIKVSANQSVEIPFVVDVPDQVDPGDHHLAFLVGTRPNGNKGEGSSIKVSSMLGSLLLLNVSGDVNESGVVREFTTDKQVYDFNKNKKGGEFRSDTEDSKKNNPVDKNVGNEVKFVLRFENTGNTILQPQGEIKISDWRDRDKGSVGINQKTNTGNVFPKDTRKWEYKWPVPSGLLEMGRYRADMILSYGNVAKDTVNETRFFWVIQWRPLAITIGSFLFFALLLIILVRRYIRNAIIKTQEQIQAVSPGQIKTVKQGRIVGDMQSVVDLKVRSKPNLATVAKRREKKKSLPIFKKLILVFSTALLLVVVLFIYFYFDTVETKTIPLEELQLIQNSKEKIEIERELNSTSSSQLEEKVREVATTTSAAENMGATSTSALRSTSSDALSTSSSDVKATQ